MKIEVGQVWRDLDYRSFYNTLPDGTYPVPDEYEGRLDQQPRLVKVIDRVGRRVFVENLHNGRKTIIGERAFHGDNSRRQGFVPEPWLAEDER